MVLRHFKHTNNGYIMLEIVEHSLVRPTACVKEIIHLVLKIMEVSFEIRSCVEILANCIQIYTTGQLIKNYNVYILEDLHTMLYHKLF